MLTAVAAFISLIGSQSFPDTPARWTFGELDPVTHDAATGVVAYSAVPSVDVGCGRAVRFVVDAPRGIVLAIYCAEDDGTWSLLATGGR
ncbi:MAG TPA: hypothetical protein VFD92_04790 [Candidatus Binatia bacterium]|nr:hypothetical protein [Candidatus Binatia bacterium]